MGTGYTGAETLYLGTGQQIILINMTFIWIESKTSSTKQKVIAPSIESFFLLGSLHSRCGNVVYDINVKNPQILTFCIITKLIVTRCFAWRSQCHNIFGINKGGSLPFIATRILKLQEECPLYTLYRVYCSKACVNSCKPVPTLFTSQPGCKQTDECGCGSYPRGRRRRNL